VNRVYRLVWNRCLAMFVPKTELARAHRKTKRTASALTGLIVASFAMHAANATTFIDFNNGLADWTTGGSVTLSSTTVTVPTGGATFTLTPATGYDMARVNAPNGGNLFAPDSTLGLTANSLENFLNNSDGHITNFGLLTKSFSFNPGTYTFAWAYGAQDYQPYNDGAVFTLSGSGSQSLVSLARNGSNPSDLSGPSPDTLILGSYGATPWLTMSFDIATAGTYQVGFAVYNWKDQTLAPNLYVSGIEGTYTGTPAQVSGGTIPTPPPPTVIGGTGGNVSGSVFDPTSPAYAETTLTFSGGTLQYASDTTTSKDATLAGSGGAIDTNGYNIGYTGVISGGSDFYKEGAGTLTLSAANTYTGVTKIDAGTLKLIGTGAIDASSGIVNDGILDITDTTSGASVKTMSGSGSVELGTQKLTITNAADTFAGTVKGSGSLEVDSGSFELTGANTYTGTTQIDTGTLKLSGTGSIAASSAVVNNGTFDISGTTAGASVKTIEGNGAVELGSQKLVVLDASSAYAGDIKGAGALEIASGSLELTGANTYTGATNIAGTLKLTGAGTVAASSAVINEGTFDISGTSAGASIKTITGSGAVSLGGKPLTITAASGGYDGGFDGAGALNISGGTLTLGGTSTNTGGTNVTHGAKLIVLKDEALGGTSNVLTLNDGALANNVSLSISHDVVVEGTSAFETAADTSITTAGKLSGGGNLLKLGAGALVLANDNSAFGQPNQPANIIVNEGTLVLANANGLGNAGVQLNAGSLQATTTTIVSAPISVASKTAIWTAPEKTLTIASNISTASGMSGDGCFEKNGAGTLILGGVANIAPGTCVQDGKLYANGTLNSKVTVQSDGTLRGTGTINGDAVVNGRLAPGNSPGTLQVAGTVTMATGSTFQEDINGLGIGHGPGNYSRLVLTGTGSQFVATGATLEPNLTNITGSDTYVPYVPKVGDAFRIVTAEGGIVGKFATVTQPDGLEANTRIETFYDVANSNSIDLVITPTSYRAYVGSHAGNQNAQSAAGAIDSLVDAKQTGTTSAVQEALLYTLSTQTNIEGLSTALSGEVHGALAAAAPLATRWLTESVGRQLNYGAQPSDGTGLWVDTGANRSDWKGDSVASGFDTTRSQVALGWDALSTESARLGVGFTHGKVDVQDALGSGSITQDIGFVYGQLHAGPVVIDALGSTGSSDWETSRLDPLSPTTTLSTDFGGHDSAITVGLSVPLSTTHLALSPYARVTAERMSRDSFDEGSASMVSLSAADRVSHGTRTTAGLTGGSREQRPTVSPFTYQFDVGIGRDSDGMAQPTFDARFAGMSTVLTTPDVGRTFGFARVGGTARVTSWMYGYLGISAETRSGKTEDLGANLGIRATF
jgi:fibronectin-binding autotransporter adhesin